MERYHAFWRRLCAGLIDGVVLATLSLLAAKFITSKGLYLSYGITVDLALIPILYGVLLTGLLGQTIGKIIMGIKVLDLNEKQYIGIKRAVFRDSVPIFFQVVSLLILGLNQYEIVFISDEFSSFVESVISKTSFLWFILELITMLLSKKRRAVHDLLASSVVISLKGLRFDKLDEELAAQKSTP